MTIGPFRAVFETTSHSMREWVTVGLLALAPALIVEGTKLLRRAATVGHDTAGDGSARRDPVALNLPTEGASRRQCSGPVLLQNVLTGATPSRNENPNMTERQSEDHDGR